MSDEVTGEVADEDGRDNSVDDTSELGRDEFDDGAVDGEADEFDADDADDIPDLDEDLDSLDEYETDLDVVELTSKEQSARSLEIRRALEERRERQRMSEDLDYLDLDLDD